MITVVKQPSNAVLARNDVKYVLSTNNYLVSAGSKAEIQIFVDSFTNTGTFTLNFMGKSYVFTGSHTDDNSGLQYYDGFGYSNYLDYANAFKIWIERNFDLNTHYDFVITGAFSYGFFAKIIAKKVGTIYNITGSTTAANTSLFAPVAGVNASYRERFKILHDIYFEDDYASDNFRLLFSGSGMPNESNEVDFNFSVPLTSALQFHIPKFGAANYYRNNAAKSYYTKYAESFGFPTTITAYKKTATKLVLLGAQNFVTAAQETFETNYISTPPQKFITNMPNGTVVSQEQAQYLSFYVYDTVTIKLFVQLFYTDNSSEIVEVNTYDPITTPGIYTFAVGYSQLSLDDYKVSTKTVKAYTVTFWDASADEIYTQSQSFDVDQMPQLFARHILFFNSFGLPETIYFTGKQTKNVQFKSDLVRKADLQFDTENGIYEGEFTESNNELQFGYELNSGWRSADWINYFTDFILSRKRLLQAADKWIGLNIPAQKISLLEDDKPLVAVKFNYQDSFIEKGVAE